MRAGTNPSPRIIATSALDHLYQIDTPAELKECLNAFLMAIKGSFSTLSKKDEDALIAAVTTGEKPISPELYQRYADNFRRAVDAVPIDDTDLSAQWHANVSRFAAYKAYHATEELRRIAEEEDGDMAFLRATLHKYNRYQTPPWLAPARVNSGSSSTNPTTADYSLASSGFHRARPRPERNTCLSITVYGQRMTHSGLTTNQAPSGIASAIGSRPTKTRLTATQTAVL